MKREAAATAHAPQESKSQTMRRDFAGIVSALIIWSASTDAWAQETVKSADSAQIKATQAQYDLVPDVPLIERVGQTPDSVLTIFREAGMSPRLYSPSESDLKKILVAIELLPPLHQKVLKQRLRKISLLNDMPNTALTSTVNSDDPISLFDITIRAAILGQSAAEWITEKESSCFERNETTFSLRADVGKITAIQYVLLHEATHIVDATMEITPSLIQKPEGDRQEIATPFTEGVWENARTPVSRYRNSGLMSIRFRQGGKVMDASKMKDLYEALGKTPFVSLYGSSARTEDLAEYLTVYHLTQELHQPFRISVYDGAREVLCHDPMASEITQKRFALMRKFYESK